MIRTKINTILQFICEIQGSQFFATETMLVPCFYLHIQGWREKPENALFKKITSDNPINCYNLVLQNSQIEKKI